MIQGGLIVVHDDDDKLIEFENVKPKNINVRSMYTLLRFRLFRVRLQKMK